MDSKVKCIKIVLSVLILSTASCTSASSLDSMLTVQVDCGYYMCRYEEDNIDTIILGHASENRVIMFGEIHDSSS